MTLEFVDNLLKLPNPSEMGEWDKIAIEFGIPEEILMENAARECLSVISTLFYPLKGKKFWLFMGHGNNGGDAVCLARHLHDNHANVTVLHLADLESFKGSANYNIRLAKKDNVKFLHLEKGDEYSILDKFTKLSRPDFIIDGLLGTGFSGYLRAPVLNLINCLNKYAAVSQVPIISLDIPSGLNGSTGLPSPVAICADYTITFTAPKQGLVLSQAHKWTGNLIVREIGMPSTLDYPCNWCLLDGRGLIKRIELPQNSFKNIYGHVLIIGGIPQYTGAPTLAALSALKTGAGLVTIYCPVSSIPVIKSGFPEIMTISAGPEWPDSPDDLFKKLLEHVNSIIIGPGMGRSGFALSLIKNILRIENRPRAIIDADALVLIGMDQEISKYITEKDILSPHPGEAGALLAISGRDVQADRIDAIKKLCEKFKAAVILKGADTRILQNGFKGLLCAYDIPQLAIGGSGDVLSGILGALSAALIDAPAHEIAARGVITHALAGMILAKKYPQRGGLARELADAIAQIEAFLNDFPVQELKLGCAPWPQFC